MQFLKTILTPLLIWTCLVAAYLFLTGKGTIQISGKILRNHTESNNALALNSNLVPPPTTANTMTAFKASTGTELPKNSTYRYTIPPTTANTTTAFKAFTGTNSTKNQRKILFYHFHKSGGTNFCRLARKNNEITNSTKCTNTKFDGRLYKPSLILQQDCMVQEQHLREMAETFLSVEFYFDWTRRCNFSAESNIITVAILRHPASRLASQYVFSGKQWRKKLTPSALLKHSPMRFYTRDYQTRRILNKFDDRMQALSQDETNFALSALNDIDIVFPVERYCEASFLLREKLSWQNHDRATEPIVAKTFEEKYWSFLEQYNAADVALWKAAGLRLDESLKELGLLEKANSSCPQLKYEYIKFEQIPYADLGLS